MASLPSPTSFLLFLLLLLHHLALSSPTPSSLARSQELSGRRNLALMEEEEEEAPSLKLKPPSKKKLISETKNQTKPIKPKKSNSTATTTSSFTAGKIKLNKLNKTLNVIPKSSNSTKLPKPIKPIKSNSTKTQLKSHNSTSNPPKSQKKTLDLSLPKNKNKNSPIPKPQQPTKPNVEEKKKQQNPPPKKPEKPVPWLDGGDADGGDDLITEFRDLPSRFLPDLERISVTSKTYISRANKGIAEGMKPFVGNKYAPTIASIASAAFLLLPLLLLTLLFHQLRSYLSLQRVLISIQAYLAIYFATLALTAVLTGLEPLRFFYATSPSSYACTQALQTLGYVLYLLVQLIHLVVVFSSSGAGDDGGAAARALGLAQMVVGLAVGLHYYAVVFHRAVTGEPPRANWKVHGMYAACFLVICALARAERSKKAYMTEGGDVGKKS